MCRPFALCVRMCGGSPAVRATSRVAVEMQKQQQQRPAAAKRLIDLAVPDDRAWIRLPCGGRPLQLQVHGSAGPKATRVRIEIGRGRCTDARTRVPCLQRSNSNHYWVRMHGVDVTGQRRRRRRRRRRSSRDPHRAGLINPIIDP